MSQTRIKLVGGLDTAPVMHEADRDALVARCLAAAQGGNGEAYFDLGVVFSTGSGSIAVDLVEAHKWFNLAAVGGHAQAAQCRAEIADEMTAREVAEAQRRAREWLRASPARKVA